MVNKMSRILVVEDNPRYREGADKYFSRQTSLETAYAIDYDSAIPLLPGDPRQDGVISDVFFPKKTGSGDITLGKEAIKKMAELDSQYRAIQDVLDEVGKYVKIDDELREYLVNFASSVSVDKEFVKPKDSPVILAIIKVGETLGPEAATHIAKNSLGVAYKIKDRDSRPDYFGALEKAMQESEANQPLGILIGERADELDIPFILATSTHHHDILTQPVQNYTGKKGWHLIDCIPGEEDEKATPEFWKRVYECLNI